MTREVVLTQGKIALVDDEDYERVMVMGKWYAAKNSKGRCWYAQIVLGPKSTRKTLQLHRFLMGEPAGAEVDHRNEDGLDCRRSNLRICPGWEGNRRNRGKKTTNTSGFKGVYACGEKWRARLGIGPRVSPKRLHLGVFNTREEAARAYDVAALQYHGEFASLNFSGAVA